MKALVKRHAKPGLWLEHDQPIPEVGPNDVRIKVNKTSICGTDMHIYDWDAWAQRTIPVPMIVGHEFCGEVVEVGSHVAGIRVGQRVSGEGHITCGHCRRCRAGKRHLCRNTQGLGVNRTGAFAEYVVLPAINVFDLPDDLPDSIAAFLDPLGNATHTALSFDIVGEDVLITGAGPIGLMACEICRHIGARNIVITDVNPYRLEIARNIGATLAIDVRERDIRSTMPELGMKEGFDVGLEMSGHGPALAEMLENMNHGGRVALLGIPPSSIEVDINLIIFKSLFVKGIYGREMFETWYKMGSLLRSGLDVSPVLTHELPFDQFEEAFAIMHSGQCGKIVLDWTGAHEGAL